jgi:hypothetical protein
MGPPHSGRLIEAGLTRRGPTGPGSPASPAPTVRCRGSAPSVGTLPAIMSLAAISPVTWIAAVCGLSAFAFLLIVVAPGRRMRSDSRRLDQEIETRLLLGEDPDELAEELDARAAQRPPVADLHPDDSA